MEYNELTKELLAAGYTEDHYPDYVTINGYHKTGESKLSNFDGGFVYQRWWIYGKTFRTPCGLQCKGTSCMTGLNYMGIDFDFENDLATISCPYGKKDCDRKHPILRDAGALSNRCNAHLVDEEYRYEGSVEGIEKLHDDEIRREKLSFSLQHHGRVCQNHMHYDRDKYEWSMHYDPGICARFRCMGSQGNVRTREICPILGRQLDKKKGNVYYDLKTTRRRDDLDGTLFEGQIDTTLKKGIRVFDHPVSMDICRNYVKLCKDMIRDKVKMEFHSELFFAEYYGRDFSIEVLNIRAESRPSRDLMQDLQDIQAGIDVFYDADQEKEKKEDKRIRRAAARKKQIERMEKRILKEGYESLEQYDQDKACRMLGYERLEKLEEMRQQNMEKEKDKPVQISLFDTGQ